MKKFNALDWIVCILVIIGGINWGLYGIFKLDLVASLFGTFATLTRIVYILVGLSALYLLVTCSKLGKK